jgi:uroporphyrinogen-III synthase
MKKITHAPSTKLTVLLTRPKVKSQELASTLSELNIASYIQPLFDYESTAKHTDIDLALTNASIVIFVSVPAVEFTHNSYPLTDKKLKHLQFFAIGQATKKALQALGIPNVLSPESPLLETSEGLLQLPELGSEANDRIANQSIVIFRGNGGREHIAKTLTQRGAQICYIESYQRIWSNFSQKTVKGWKSKKINCIVATSNDILNALVTLIQNDDSQLEPFWREQCIWVVASQRISDNAKTLGLINVINSHGASTEQLSEKLQYLQLNKM